MYYNLLRVEFKVFLRKTLYSVTSYHDAYSKSSKTAALAVGRGKGEWIVTFDGKMLKCPSSLQCCPFNNFLLARFSNLFSKAHSNKFSHLKVYLATLSMF